MIRIRQLKEKGFVQTIEHTDPKTGKYSVIFEKEKRYYQWEEGKIVFAGEMDRGNGQGINVQIETMPDFKHFQSYLNPEFS